MLRPLALVRSSAGNSSLTVWWECRQVETWCEVSTWPQLKHYCLVKYITQKKFRVNKPERASSQACDHSCWQPRYEQNGAPNHNLWQVHRIMSTANGSTQAVNTPVSDAAVPAASPATPAEAAAVAPPLPDAAPAPAANGAISASVDAAEHPAPPAQNAEADTDQAGTSAEAAGPSEPAGASAEPIPALPENADELLKVSVAICQRGLQHARPKRQNRTLSSGICC